jgi:tetratricopeptide (TPR) repeat protein
VQVKFRRLILSAWAVACLGACANRLPPVSKLVNDRRITTRSVNASAYEHASRAFMYEEEERYQDAAAELQRALVFDDESPELQAHLAEDFIRLGRMDDAVAAIAASMKIEVTADGLMAEAHLRQARGDALGAVEPLRKAMELVDFGDEPDKAQDTYLELAEAQIVALDVSAAEATLVELCRREPASINGHMRLMAVSWALGDVAQTEAHLRQALNEEPNQIEALTGLAWLLAAQGREPEARHVFRDALDRSDSAPEIAAAFARFLVSIGDRTGAEQLAEDMVPSLTAVGADGFPAAIEMERSARRLDRALALIAKAEASGMADDAKIRLALNKAALLKDKGQGEQAMAALLAVPKDSVLYYESRLRAAELLRESGKTSEAAEQVKQAVKAAGEDPERKLETAIAQAFVDEKRGDAVMATRRLETLRTRHPDYGPLTLSLAMIEERRGAWPRALSLVEGLLKKKPGAVELLNFWGFVAADHGHDLPLARKRLQSAAARDPGSSALLDSLGWVSFRAGELDRAGLFLEQAGRLDPNDPEILTHLGDLYAKRAEPARAILSYRKALEQKPDERLRRRLEESLSRLESQRAAGR